MLITQMNKFYMIVKGNKAGEGEDRNNGGGGYYFGWTGKI